MKKFLALFLTALLLLAPMTIFAVGATSNKDINEEKITDELKEVMSDKKNNEYIPIYIWLYDLGDNVIYNRLSSQKNKNITSDSETEYLNNRIEEKIKEYEKQWLDSDSEKALLKFEKMTNKAKSHSLRNEAKISNRMTEEELDCCIKEGKTYEEIIELSERTQYLSEFRENRSTVNLSLNGYFESLLKTNKVKNIYSDKLLPYVQLECKKSYIAELSAFSMVEEIGIYEETKFSNEETLLENDENVYPKQNLTNNHEMLQQETFGYTGNGIKIGVLEHEAEYAKSNFCIHLSNVNVNRNTKYFLNKEHTTYSHTLAVLAILCGKPMYGYSGIAPNSTVYLAGFLKKEQLKESLYWLIVESGVHVVNISAKIAQDGNYSNYDKYIDCLVQQYRVAIVKSAGNKDVVESDNDPVNNFVSSPGLARNVITVGNATKDQDENNKYYMKAESGYIGCGWNKPDLVAFGTRIIMYCMNQEYNIGTGTSFAAPMVTGTIALMMEKNPELIGKPDLIKAILVASADADAISNVIQVQVDEDGTIENLSNPIVNSYHYASSSHFTNAKNNIRLRSGAGLLNIQNAIIMSYNLAFYRYSISVEDIGSNPKMVTPLYHFDAGQTVKITLVYENSEHQLFDINNAYPTLPRNVFNLKILDSNNAEIMTSNNYINNVETFTCTFSEAGCYRIKVNCDSLATNEPPLSSDGISAGNSNVSAHIEHKDFFVSLIIGCGCPRSMIYKKPCIREGHDIVCDNCNFSIFEHHETSKLINDSTNTTVTYDVKYMFKYSPDGIGAKVRSCYQPLNVTVVSKNANYVANVISETYDSEYLSDGTLLETHTFWIFLTDSTGEIIFSTYQTVKVYCDVYLGKYYIVNT